MLFAQSSRFRKLICTILAGLSLLLQPPLGAAPFDTQIEFIQPDGAKLLLRGRGDEFYAVFETLAGYTVVFDPKLQAYCFAAVAADGQLASTGAPAHLADPAALGLTPHLRMSDEARRQQVRERRKVWDQGLEIEADWAARKAAARAWEAGLKDGDAPLSPPSFTTTGQKLGLTLLIDFSDDPAVIPQADIVAFCNGDNYTGYGNNGSVKQYFYDNSNGLLTYSNVVTIYIRAPKPKSYYNITTNDSGGQANLLIKDALDTMKALPNYTSEILPAFANLTVDGSSRVVACNVFYAGGNGGVWSKGLWPHSWSLYHVGAQPLGNGKSVYKYQVTNIGGSLSIGTFCHENGHMLCGYPDIYDYDYDSSGGAGRWCLMNSGGSGGNPAQICAYLKRASGWATTINVTSNSALLATVAASGADFNKFYRYQKPGVNTEYYLLENRQKTGRDAGIPGPGILIWHIDELGQRDNQSTNYNTSHANYECSLIQADNQYHLQRDVNSGDAADPFYLGNNSAGYINEFSFRSAPPARWWDGSLSGAIFSDFSVNGQTMTFRIGAPEPPLSVAFTFLADANGNGVVDFNETTHYWVVLRNDGAANASNVTATLSTPTPLVSVPAATASYPNFAPGQLATNTTPFVFATATGFPCGGDILFTALASVPGRATTNTFVQPTGAAPPPSRWDNNVARSIPDLSTVFSTNVVSGFTGAVGKVTVSLYLTHSYDGNLVIDLIAPDGTTNNLVNRRGGSSDHFGSGCAPDGNRTTFDDSALMSIAGGAAPFVGTFRPEVPFTVHAGKSGAAVNGPWRLRLRDAAASNTGTLQCWSLQLTPAASCVDGAWQPPVVTLHSPVDRQVLPAGEPVLLNATVTDADSPLARVEFRADGAPLATFTEPPFAFAWTDATPGAHFIEVRAEDVTGLFAAAGAWVGISDTALMQWRGDVSSLWGDPYNWTQFRAPTNGEPLRFARPGRLLTTNNLLSTAGPILLSDGGFVLGGNWLTLVGGITNSGNNTLALPTRLGASQTFLSADGLLTLSANVTNPGYALTLQGEGDLAFHGTISGSGNLQKRGAGTATLHQTNAYTSGTVVYEGTLALAAGGSNGAVRGALTIHPGATVRSERANALGYGIARVNPLLIPGGTLLHAANEPLSLLGLTINLTGGTLAAPGGAGASLDLGTDPGVGGASAIVTVGASATPSVISANLLRLRQTTVIVNVVDGGAHPDLVISAPISSLTNNSGINKAGFGALLLSGTNTYNGVTTVSGGTLIVNGALGTNTVNVLGGATLAGQGLIRGRVIINGGATLAPGDDLGRLTISNALQLSGAARFELRRDEAGWTNDCVFGIGALSLGGALVVTNLGPEAPPEGELFRLFEAASVSGNFATVQLPPLDPGLGWDTSRLNTEGVIEVATLPGIVSQPHSVVAPLGSPAGFSVTATSASPLAYQWWKDGAPLAGATASEYVIEAVSVDDLGAYRVVLANLAGAVTSAVAFLNVPAAPVIVTQPVNLVVRVGEDAVFEASAEGHPAPMWQWFFNDLPLEGATAPMLVLINAQETNAGSYFAVARNDSGAATSAVATLTMVLPPFITSQPEDLLVWEGDEATFGVTAGGTAPLAYQWRHNGEDLAGATESELHLPGVGLAATGGYDVVITNAAGAVTSAVATLTILAPPAILTPPAPLSVLPGDAAHFTVAAAGTAPLAYQWRREGEDLAGATLPTLTLDPARPGHAGAYDVVVSNFFGVATSGTALLSVGAPPALSLTREGEMFVLSWPVGYLGFRLEAQTNSLLMGLDESWFEVPGVTNNSLHRPLNGSGGAEFFRLVLP